MRLLAGQRDKAVSLLEEAQAASPRDPRMANDLAVALQPTHGDGDPVNALRTLDLLLQPFASSSETPWLHYNRALFYRRVGLLQEALPAFETAFNEERVESWQTAIRRQIELLRQERTTEPWPLARQRLLDAAERDDRPIVKNLITQWTLGARDELEEEVLGAWGQDLLEGRADDAERKMRMAKLMAAELARLGDHFAADALPHLSLLAEAHRDYRDARRAQMRGEFEEAEKRARAAASKFRRAGSPFSAIADRVVATCRYQRGKIDHALADCERALHVPAVRRYPSVAGRWLWLKGICLVGRGRPAEALESYSQARRQFEAIGDAEGIALSETFSAETLNYLGQTGEAAQRLSHAMRLSAQLPGRARLELVPSELATLCARLHLLRVALAFQDTAVRQGRASGLGYSEGYALMERARIHLRAGSPRAATADLTRARLLWKKTEDGALHERMQADLEVAEGGLQLLSNPQAAVLSFESALRYFEGVGRTFQPLAARYQLARARLAEGHVEEARSSLERGLSSRETLRATLRSESQRESFFDEAQAFFDDLVRSAFRAGDMEAAFDAAERSRSRVLLDRLAGDTPVAAVIAAPPPLAEIRRRLPTGTALIEFHLDSDRVRALFIGSTEVVGKDLASRHDLAVALRALGRRHHDDEESETILATLYDLLLRPFEKQLANARLLVLVPHRELFGLPFAALYDRRTGRFLLERKTLTVAPSAAVALPGEAPAAASNGASKVLVFADPQIDVRDSGFGLSPLSGARAEAALVAAQYGEAVVREGSDARITAFLREAGRFDVVHVAAHGQENSLQPGRSFLAFARGEGDESGWLTAEVIAGTHFAKTRLVVLAACEGAKGTATGSEGALSVARAFLATGVPGIVASLAVIEDRTAEGLFTTFHRHFAAGEAPAEALRQAQLELLHSADPHLRSPSQWGYVQFIGRSAADNGRR